MPELSTPMNAQHARAIGALLGIMALLIGTSFWMTWKRGPTDPLLTQPTPSLQDQTSGHANAPSPLIARDPSLDGVRPSLLVHRIEVVDPMQRAVSSATLYLEPKRPGLLHASDRRRVAATGADGVVEVEFASLLSAGEAGLVVIRHPEFSPALVELPTTPGSQRVVLERGAMVHLEVRTPAGDPVKGARVALSTATIPRDSIDDFAIGGSSVAGRVMFSALESGADGTIEFRGLSPATHFFCIDHPLSFIETDLAAAEVASGSFALSTGESKRIRCTVYPLMAVAFIVDGDDVLYCGHGHRSQAIENGYVAESSLGRARAALKSKLEKQREYRAGQGPNVCVRALFRSTSIEPTEKWFLELARSGEQVIEVPFRAIAEIEEPLRFDFSSSSAGGPELADLRIRVFDARKRELQGAQVAVMPQRQFHRLRMLRSDESIRVRPGTYEVSFEQEPWLNDRLRVDPITLDPGAKREIDLQILEPASRLEITAKRTDGLPLGYAMVFIECSSGYRTELRGLSSTQSLSLWLPESLAKIRVVSAGLQEQVHELVLGGEQEKHALAIVW